MTVWLLDVNVLIAILDSMHVHHATAVAWFRRVAAASGWATCPLTENGFVRIVSHVSYPNLRVTAGMAAQSLRRFQESFAEVHRFWPDDVSLLDSTLFDPDLLPGPKQITDAYLAGLAFRHGGKLATLDSGVAWRTVRGASSELVHQIS